MTRLWHNTTVIGRIFYSHMAIDREYDEARETTKRDAPTRTPDWVFFRAGGMAFVVSLALACAHGDPHTFPVRDYSSDVRDGVTKIRAATARFANLDSAAAAGYAPGAPRCFADSAQGAMGFHHVNRGYIDAQLDVTRPEILLYERSPDGRYSLNAVEFLIPYSRWPADSVAPVFLGQTLKRYDDLRIWSIHMWIWKKNPSGLFADWNPAVHCPAGAAATMSH